MKILLTVGTHNEPFDALIESCLNWPCRDEHEWIVQSGPSKLVFPDSLQQSHFEPNGLRQHLEDCDLVVAHAGCGIAREVQELGKHTLFMCRRRSRREHVDDHQLELKEVLSQRPGLEFIEPGDDFEEAIKNLQKQPAPSAPPELGNLIQALSQWLTSST